MDKSFESITEKSQITRKDEIISAINETIIKICQSELFRMFEELKEDLFMRIESDMAIAMQKFKEVA